MALSEREILEYLSPGPASNSGQPRAWIPSSTTTQIDIHLPLGQDSPDVAMAEIAGYLRQAVGVARILDQKSITPGTFVAFSALDEQDARDAGFKYLPYQLFFDPSDARRVQAHVTARLAQLGPNGGGQAPNDSWVEGLGGPKGSGRVL